MPSTRLADIIEPSVFLDYMREKRPERNILTRSGIYAPAPEAVATQMASGGSTIDMPFWKDLDRTEPNIMSDDPAQEAVPEKMGSGKDQAIKHFHHKSWSVMQLAAQISGGDPASAIMEYAMSYWEWVEQQIVIRSSLGLLADNKANFGGDMVFSIYSDLASPTAANKISHVAVNRARSTMGDAGSQLAAIGMHSALYYDLLDQEKIETIPASETKPEIMKYSGLEVLVDDDMPVTAGTNSPKYTCILYGKGAYAYADTEPEAPAAEVESKPGSGNGGGQEILHNRNVKLVHPRGVKFTKDTMAEKSPSFAELENAANWSRVHDRKHVRLGFLETN